MDVGWVGDEEEGRRDNSERGGGGCKRWRSKEDRRKEMWGRARGREGGGREAATQMLLSFNSR